MKQLTIIVPLPHRSLSPNARAHWRTVHSQKKKAKNISRLSAIAAYITYKEAPRWKEATVHVKAYFKDRRSKWDRDNFIASLKATMDGIAEAGVMENDRGVHWGTVELSGIDKEYPRVELTFVPMK